MPAGWLATRSGYKGGIISGLMMVAIGGFWFIPATNISSFWAFLLGVCVIASGLTFLETVANPYTTVLGPSRYAATRINLAQSCNGVGWILGPIIGSLYFYSKDAAGHSTGSQTLYIPYVSVAVIVRLFSCLRTYPTLKPKTITTLSRAQTPLNRFGLTRILFSLSPRNFSTSLRKPEFSVFHQLHDVGSTSHTCSMEFRDNEGMVRNRKEWPPFA